VLTLLILFINTPAETFTPTRSGAVATHVYQTARRALAAGRDARVIARPHPEAEPYGDVPCDLFPYPAEPTGAHRLARRAERKVRGWTHTRFGEYAKQLVRTVRPYVGGDTAFVIHNDPEVVGWLRAAYPGARLVHWFHNQHVCKDRPRRRFSGLVDRVACVSEYTRRWVVPAYGCAAGQASVVYNGVDLEAFAPAADGAGPNRVPVVNFTGRTGREKGLDILLEAARRLASAGQTGFSVQVIGSNHWGARTLDAYQAELDGLVNALERLGVGVSMLGHLDRAATAAAMRSADIHVVPSRWDEPFGLSTLEGMASGLATVVSRTGGSLEVLGEAGLSFEREDAAGLAGHLRHLIEDGAARERLGAAGRSRAMGFSWDRTWSGMAELVEGGR